MALALTPMEQSFNATLEHLLSLDDVDARKGPTRRVRAYARRLATDLGGADTLSTAQQQLIQRASMLAAICEHTETCLLLGRQDVSIGDYLAAISVQKRLLEALGLERKPRDAGFIDILRAGQQTP
jgi:hypothetical protein